LVQYDKACAIGRSLELKPDSPDYQTGWLLNGHVPDAKVLNPVQAVELAGRP